MNVGRYSVSRALMRVGFVAAMFAAFSLPTAGDGADAPVDHETLVVSSIFLGEDRTVNVHVPATYATGTESYPVLYMLDGGIDEDFPHVVAMVDSLVAEQAIRPVVVVGIPNTQRRRDLTGPSTVASDVATAPEIGGSAAFRRFISRELVLEIERRYRTTSERAVIGESLAGLFVVETLIEEPSLFTHYVALDPSLWWNGGALAESAESKLGAQDGEPRTLFLASSRDDIDSRVTQLAEILARAAPAGLRWQHLARPDLTHATIFRGVEREALADALR